MNPSAPRPRRILTWPASIACGLAAAFAHPPFGILPGLLGYAGMLILFNSAPNFRSAFWRGWLAGTAYFAVGCWWVFEAFQVDASTFGWMAPFAVALLAAGLALFWGAVGLIYRLGAGRSPWTALWFAGVFAALEWTRGHIFTGFPWNLPGETWRAGGIMSQSAALGGAYGLTWITLAIAAAPALLVINGVKRSSLAALALAGAGLAGMAVYGQTYLKAAPDHPGKTITLRIVQPDFIEHADYSESLFREMLAKYLALTAQPSDLGEPPAYVFWPEGALPRSVNELMRADLPAYGGLMGTLKPGQILIFGGGTYRDAPAYEKYYNSLVAVQRTDAALVQLADYDKHRLVPFGEYTPAFLTTLGLKKLVPTPGDAQAGPPPAPIEIAGLTIQPLICYESLFPGFTRQGAKLSGRRADLIVNLSNDSWFGVTSGPRQTYNLSAYRAIEEGLMEIRSTPNGVSAVIDPHGRALSGKRLGLRQSGVVDARVNTVQFDTLYRRYGELLLVGMLLVSLLAFGAIRLGRRGEG